MTFKTSLIVLLLLLLSLLLLLLLLLLLQKRNGGIVMVNSYNFFIQCPPKNKSQATIPDVAGINDNPMGHVMPTYVLVADKAQTLLHFNRLQFSECLHCY